MTEQTPIFIVKMEVTATVEPPEGVVLSEEEAIELAMGAVTQFQEIQCGRDVHPIFAKVHAEVSEDDCEIIQ